MVNTLPAPPVSGSSAAIRALETHAARPASTAAPSSVANEHVPELFGRRGLVRLAYPAPEPTENAAYGLPRGRSYFIDDTSMKIPRAAPIKPTRIGSGGPHAMPLAAEGARSASQPVARSGPEGR